MIESRELWNLKTQLWTSQVLDFDPFDKQRNYCTFREMFGVNYLRQKYIKH